MCKDNIKNGYRTTNKEVQRKHYTQMTENEIIYLTNKLNILNSLAPVKHAQDKLDLLDIQLKYIRKILHNIKTYQILEYNTGKGDDQRVLIRDVRILITDKKTRVNANYVIDINTGKLVTVFVNEVQDRHEKLDLGYYNKELRIKGVA